MDSQIPRWKLFNAPRMAHIRYRSRLMALVGAAVTLGLLPNELLLGKALDYPLLVGFRLGVAGALFLGALAIRRSPQTPSAALAGTFTVFLLFLAGFFFFPLGLLDNPPPILATAYTMTPVAILAFGGVFPFRISEGALLIAVILGFFLSAVVGQLLPPDFALAQATWALVLLAGVVLWLQKMTWRALEYAEVLGRTDPLTGIYNRRGLEEAGARLGRGRNPFSVVMIDLDQFKAFNDLGGHACGDRALQTLARALLESTRGEDVVGRLGGDEFVILASAGKKQEVRALAERVQETLRRAPPLLEKERRDQVPLTISMGIAIRTKGETFPAVLQRANKALQSAKQEGREGIVVAGEPTSETPGVAFPFSTSLRPRSTWDRGDPGLAPAGRRQREKPSPP